jgi:hypothetical protein
MNYRAAQHKASAFCRILVGQPEERKRERGRERFIKGLKFDPEIMVIIMIIMIIIIKLFIKEN